MTAPNFPRAPHVIQAMPIPDLASMSLIASLPRKLRLTIVLAAAASLAAGLCAVSMVALINRVTQIYEDETSIRLMLINDTEKLNLDTTLKMTGANGPCGGAACFTTNQASGCGGGTLTRNRMYSRSCCRSGCSSCAKIVRRPAGTAAPSVTSRIS